jgi:hypothetical protein
MNPSPLTIATADYTPAKVYCGLRDQTLRLADARKAAGPGGAIAALMETGYEQAVATLVAIDDGTTSLYLSNGGGIIGAGSHQPVVAAASAFLQAASRNISLMQPTTSYPLPRPRHTRFYVLSTDGSWTAEALEDDLGNNRLPLSPLFHLAHAVIAAVRRYSRYSPPSGA